VGELVRDDVERLREAGELGATGAEHEVAELLHPCGIALHAEDRDQVVALHVDGGADAGALAVVAVAPEDVAVEVAREREVAAGGARVGADEQGGDAGGQRRLAIGKDLEAAVDRVRDREHGGGVVDVDRAGASSLELDFAGLGEGVGGRHRRGIGEHRRRRDPTGDAAGDEREGEQTGEGTEHGADHENSFMSRRCFYYRGAIRSMKKGANPW
jgi:hypothetical protein